MVYGNWGSVCTKTIIDSKHRTEIIFELTYVARIGGQINFRHARIRIIRNRSRQSSYSDLA